MSDRLIDLSIAAFVDAVSSTQKPVPAGGSVSALTGSSSAALLVLVCDVLEEHSPGVLKEVRELARALQQQLLQLVDDGVYHSVRGASVQAVRLLRECLAIQRVVVDRLWQPATLHGLAGVEAMRVRAEGAPAAERTSARWRGQRRPRASGRMEPLPGPCDARTLAAPAFAALGGCEAPAADAAWTAGRPISLDEAVVYALNDAA